MAQLLRIVGNEPVFGTGLLLAGDVDPADVRRQLSRWSRDGKIVRLRRGIYTLAPPYRRVVPQPFHVANRLHRPSYVSLHAALAYHGLIPEEVPVTTSVTTARPGSWETPLGRFVYRHVRTDLFGGFEEREVAAGQTALVATPEKALIDLVYLTPGGDSPEYLGGLRLQHFERIDPASLVREAARTGSRKLKRAAAVIEGMAREDQRVYERM